MIGESPANCSWHLRRLAKYGFVEETGGGSGRNRPWRPVSHTLTWGDSDEPGDVAASGDDELGAMVYAQEFAALRDWQAWRRTDPPGWQDAANFAQSVTWLTAEEPAELNEVLTAIAARGRERLRDPAERPPGARAASGSSPRPYPPPRSRPNLRRPAPDARRPAAAGLPAALRRPVREHGRRRADAAGVRHLGQEPHRLERRGRAGHALTLSPRCTASRR